MPCVLGASIAFCFAPGLCQDAKIKREKTWQSIDRWFVNCELYPLICVLVNNNVFRGL